MAPERRLIVARGTQPGATAAAGRIVREWPRPQVARPLKRDEVELIRMDAVNMAIALGKKEIAACIAWDPHTTKAVVAGTGKVLLRVEKLIPLKAGHPSARAWWSGRISPPGIRS